MDIHEKKKLYANITKKLVQGIAPQAIYIFGSFARNEENNYSDIDILIEKETNIDFINRTVGVRRLLKDIDYPIDILIYTHNELANRSQDKYSIVHHALKEGIKIYEK